MVETSAVQDKGIDELLETLVLELVNARAAGRVRTALGVSSRDSDAIFTYWVEHGSINPLAIRDEGRMVALTAQGTQEASMLAETRHPTLADITRLLAQPSASPSTWQPQSDRDCGIFRRFGDKWLVDFAGQRAFFSKTKGMSYLSHLVSHGGQEYPALVLEQEVEGMSEQTRSRSVEVLRASGLEIGGLPDVGPLMDKRGLTDVKDRLSEIRRLATEAADRRDLVKLDQLADEEEQIEKYLRRAAGRGGRPRKAEDSYGQARQRIQKNIKRALSKIEKSLPELHTHLENALQYTPHFSYRPEHIIYWEV